MATDGPLPSNPRVPYEMGAGRDLEAGPGGARLLCHVVVNVELWPFDAPAPRRILPAPHGRQPVPDVPNISWAEYGMRQGLPRILRALGARGLVASTSANGDALRAYPAAIDAMLDAGWELMAHGLRQRSLQDADDERAVIERTVATVTEITGTAPRGWLGPGLQETVDTPDHLVDAGLEYVCDWVLDDVPVEMTTARGRLVALPYALDLNDSVVYTVEHHTAAEFDRRLAATLATFDREPATGPKVLTLALHPHLIGVPHRTGTLEAMLDRLQERDDTVFLTGGGILDWYTGQVGAPSRTGGAA